MIVTKTVKARLWGNEYKRLVALGYKGNYGEWIDISVNDLLPSSSKTVEAQCKYCDEVRDVLYSQYTDACVDCSRKNAVGEKSSQWKGGHKDFCVDCGEPTSRGKGYKRCKPCFGKTNRKENNYRWREDRDNMVVRNGNMQRWANKVKSLADFVCDYCGDDESLKVSHHLNGVDNHREEMYDVKNGACLCEDCHNVFHKRYGYGNNTKEQYLDFKGEL